uniref:Uncharacterized protein n=1 Tax=Plectus sambesii TaxID=2011161 RepID=A0A914V0C2_9BILA
MLAVCNSLDKHSGEDDDDEHDEIHDCAHPTLVLKKDLRVKREHRKSSLRNCFETGHLEGSKSNYDVLNMGARHHSTCISRIAEFEEKNRLKDKPKKGSKNDDEEQPPQTKLQCKAAAKRFRERCDRLESCCVRAKLCKKDMSKTKLAKEIKGIVEEIKSMRKTCREKTSRVAARKDES